MKLDPFAKVKKNRSALPALVLGGAGLLALALVAFFWLVGEMERRFNILSAERSRDIKGYNAVALKKERTTIN